MAYFTSILFIFIAVLSLNAQDHILNEQYSKDNKIKFENEFIPDWDRNFFIEANVKVKQTPNPFKENVGLLFNYSKDKNSFYGIYIQNSGNKTEYIDYVLLKSNNTRSQFLLDEEWQMTSLINHNGFNRIQIHKIGSELFFGINDQVIEKIIFKDEKHNQIKFTTGKSGFRAKYLKAYYLDDGEELITQLNEQLDIYNHTKIHHKIADDYSKIESLKEPNKIYKTETVSAFYNPENNLITGGFIYELSTMEFLSEAQINARLTEVKFENDTFKNTLILKPNAPAKRLDGYMFLGQWNKDEIIVLHKSKEQVFKYNYKTDKYNKLFKADYDNNGFLSDDKKYLFIGKHVYSMPKGKKIKYNIKNFLHAKSFGFKSYNHDNAILAVNGNILFKVDLLTLESERIFIKGHLQDHYLININGRELNISNIFTGEIYAENIQLLTTDRKANFYTNVKYYPERDEAFVSLKNNISPQFYFSYQDKIKNTSAFVVNTKTNEINPFLLYKSANTLKKENEANAVKYEKAKQEVDQFLNQLKTFGSSYVLNYDDFEYVNVSNHPLLNRFGIGGTTYAIGKFCNYSGGSVLAVGVTQDQYQIELINLYYDASGVKVTRNKLGTTQNVNGITTQIAKVRVTRNSLDNTKYTLTVDDGKKTEVKLTSNCNL
jgi:hypothetical protein